MPTRQVSLRIRVVLAVLAPLSSRPLCPASRPMTSVLPDDNTAVAAHGYAHSRRDGVLDPDPARACYSQRCTDALRSSA